jgi:dolichyl-phosphate-mannose-protein mannosyltransferase
MGFDRRAVTFLTMAWVAAILIVNPTGDFPVLDDWAYGHVVRALVEQHRFQPTDWMSVPLIAQALWGALFCLPAGFSFTALRLSTLVLAWAGGIGMFVLLRTIGAGRGASLAGALTLLFCPVFFGLAYTFMTDVPFVACVVWACVFVARFDRDEQVSDALGAALAFIAATLIRHVGLALAVGSAIGVALGGRRQRYAAAAMMALGPLVSLAAYNAMLARIGTPALYHFRDAELIATLSRPLHAANVIRIRSLQAYVYLGVFLVPLACLVPIASTRSPRFTRAMALAILIAAPAAALLAGRRRLPLIGTTWHDIGLNAITVHRWDLWPSMSPVWWIVLTAGGVISAAVLARTLMDRRVALFTIPLACYLLPTMMLSDFMDRYLLPALALTIAIVAVSGRLRPTRARMMAAAAVLVLAAAFDVAAEHDFLSYQRARWIAIGDLLASGVPADRIEAGTYEANGWINYQPGTVFARGRDRWYDGSVEDPDALIALGPVEGYRVVATYPFNRWIGRGAGSIAVLRRSGR